MVNLQMLIQKKKVHSMFLSSCCSLKNALSSAMYASVSLARKSFWHMQSLGSSPVKMSQAFHNPSIYFNFSYFHQKVNTFKTPEMCLYLDSVVWAGCFTIIFAGSFHYFKPVSCWIQFCENVAGVPRPFDQVQSRVEKVKHVWNSWNAPLFRLSRFRQMSHNIIFVGSFPYFKFLTKINSKVRRK